VSEVAAQTNGSPTASGLVSVSGDLVVNLEANQQPLPPKAELDWWYQYDELEARLFESPAITVITIGSDFDGARADGRAYAAKFSGPYLHESSTASATKCPEEAPEAFPDAMLEVGGSR
jgi:hypothetical protein